MKFKAIATVLLLLVASSAWADAVAKVTGPTEAPPGDLVVLDATASTASAYAWTLVGSKKTFLPVENGTKVVFATGTPGVYVFVLSVAKEDTVAVAVHELTIGSPPPTPPPDPEPDPDPDPPQPAGPRDLLIFRESADDTPTQARLWTALRTGSAGEYLKSKDHALLVLDDDSEGADGRTAAVIEAWKPEFADMTLPAMFIVDRKTRKILTKTSLPPATNADDILALLKQHGG